MNTKFVGIHPIVLHLHFYQNNTFLVKLYSITFFSKYLLFLFYSVFIEASLFIRKNPDVVTIGFITKYDNKLLLQSYRLFSGHKQ